MFWLHFYPLILFAMIGMSHTIYFSLSSRETQVLHILLDQNLVFINWWRYRKYDDSAQLYLWTFHFEYYKPFHLGIHSIHPWFPFFKKKNRSSFSSLLIFNVVYLHVWGSIDLLFIESCICWVYFLWFYVGIFKYYGKREFGHYHNIKLFVG